MARTRAWFGIAAGLLWLLPAAVPARARGADPAELSRVSLPRDAWFEAPDRGRLQLSAGDYRLVLAEPGVLWVRPVGEGDPLRVAAAAGRHQESLTRPLAVCDPGSAGDPHLALLLPGGALYEAIGSASEVTERGAARLRLPAVQVAALAQSKLRVAAIRRDASDRFRAYLADPSPARRDAFRSRAGAIGGEPGVNVMEVLFHVFRESIRETNEDKKYFLGKLKQYNDMGEALGDYLAELTELSRQLGAAGGGSGSSDDCVKSARGAEGAADRVLAAVARAAAAGPAPDVRADLARLHGAVARERTALREMRALVDEVSARDQRASRPDPVR